MAATVPFNGGLSRPVRLIAPEGTVVNRSFPAPGVARNLVGQFIPTMIFAALGDVIPSLAESGSPRPTFRVTGSDRNGRAFSAPFFVMGGLGARPSKDGIACIAFPTNTEVVPIEIIEATTPLHVESKEFVTDSGGPGRFRGGLGQRIVIRCLAERARAFVVAQRLHKPAEGSAGGEAALPAMIFQNGRRMRHLTGPLDLTEGDTLTVQSAGGGGFGNPHDRSREQVEADVRAGYVSRRRARERYGLSSS
jgi:N-methylhydantoinase B